MNNKKEKSPILVVATMMFLAMFIVFPPLFRTYFPKDDVGSADVDVVRNVLECEKVSVSENMKVVSTVTYENDVAISNVMDFSLYVPTEEDIAADSGVVLDSTIQQELDYLKTIPSVDVQTGENQIVIKLTKQNVLDNPEQLELASYFDKKDLLISKFESRGYYCIQQ